MKKKVFSVFGCRPDAIKMAPLIQAIQASDQLESIVCTTGQHRAMLDQVLDLFQIKPDYDLNIMQPNQTLFDITVNILNKMKPVLEKEKPDFVLVHGDSSTAMAAGLAAFYLQIPIGHVEAGLRTGSIYSPFPEEANRQMVGAIATHHFAPTKTSAENLLREGFPQEMIHVTGNTVVDALLWIDKQNRSFPYLTRLFTDKPMVLMTMHRRENFGEPVKNILRAITDFAHENPGFQIIYPVHPNPNVREVAHATLKDYSNVSLIDPVSYEELAFLIKHSQFVVTDSGGIQEEAPTFGKPILVMRDTTERPEAIDAGCAKLVGTSYDAILSAMRTLANKDSAEYRSMSQAASPFGDGFASERIVKILEQAVDRPAHRRITKEKLI